MNASIARRTARLPRAFRLVGFALTALLHVSLGWARNDAFQLSDAVRSLDPSESVKAINETRGVPRNATAATDPILAKDLFDKCARQSGDKTKLEPEEQEGYVYGLSSEIFEKFDHNCDGNLDKNEQADYFGAQHEALQKKLDEGLPELEHQLKDKARRAVAASSSRGVLGRDEAERIAPAILTDSVALSISGIASSPPGAQKRSGKIEMKMATTPIKSFRTAYPTSLALDWTISTGREYTRTASEKTVTDDFTFTPLSYTLMSPDKNWAFKFGLGGSYVWTETKTLATGEIRKEDGLTLAYVTSLEYKLPNNPCFALKLDYELKQRHFFSEKVSSKFAPGVTIDFMCMGREGRKTAWSTTTSLAVP